MYERKYWPDDSEKPGKFCGVLCRAYLGEEDVLNLSRDPVKGR